MLTPFLFEDSSHRTNCEAQDKVEEEYNQEDAESRVRAAHSIGFDYLLCDFKYLDYTNHENKTCCLNHACDEVDR